MNPPTPLDNPYSSPKPGEQRSSPSSPQLAGQKRKRAPEKKFYAVRFGHSPGVYQTWAECLEQVQGFKGAQFKSFPTQSDANLFVANGLSRPDPKSQQKFYAVRSGRTPGVYMDWPSAEAQIKGWRAPKYKSFPTRDQADEYVRGGEPGDSLYGDASAAAAKRVKKTAGGNRKSSSGLEDNNSNDNSDGYGLLGEAYEPGTGPLPRGAQDGFDDRIRLNPKTGAVEYKSAVERARTKMMATGRRPDAGELKVWTDGSSLANGKGGAKAGLGVWFGPADTREQEERERQIADRRDLNSNISSPLPGPRQTNQRAELLAISKALDAVPPDAAVRIHTDSRYAIDCLTTWAPNWQRNGWVTAAAAGTGARKPVENRDLIEPALGKIEERRRCGGATKFEWVRGHAGDRGNEEADRLAVAGARRNGGGEGGV